MKKKDIERFKNILEKLKDETLETIDRLKQTALETNYREASGDHAGYTSHMADQGTDAMEREKAFLFLSREEKFLRQIEGALQRIELGEYGICRVCGEEIDVKRLEAVPTTRICVDCKQKESRSK
ncbi:MAG: hypothetical protein Kow00108_01170 [Calditrichia bacterium]